MNYYDILLAKKLEDDRDPQVVGLSVTENGTYSEEGKVYKPVVVNVPLPNNAYLLKSIENVDIATFDDGSNIYPLKSLEVAIEPIQSGSGDPSPTNIRPISGWDECKVTRCGKNLWANGNLENETRVSINNITLFPNTYTISAVVTSTDTDANTSGVIFEYTDGTNSSIGQLSRNTRSSCTIVATKKVAKIAFYASDNYGHSASDTFSISDIQIEIGSQPSSYHAYNGQVYTIDLDGTRYGGTLDVDSGVLVVTHLITDLGGLTWKADEGGTGYYYSSGLRNELKPNGDGVCSGLKFHNIAVGGIADGEISTATSYGTGYIFAKYTNAQSADDFKTLLNGITLVYELATPLTYQLDSATVTALVGNNVIFASTGEVIKLEYLGKETA